MAEVASGILSSLSAQAIIGLLRFVRLGEPYLDLPIPTTGILLDEIPVSIPFLPYGDFTIRGRTHELKQKMSLTVELPARTTSLTVAGWGVIAGTDRFHGALTDTGKIGELRFFNSKQRPLEARNISLPSGAGQADLRLADANPIISGTPPESLVTEKGFLGMIRSAYDPAGRNFWDHANVWLTEVGVPPRSRTATFTAIEGSMNLVHIRAIRGFRFIEYIGRLRRQSVRRSIILDPQRWIMEREVGLTRATSYETEAANAATSGSYQEAVALRNRAASEYVTIAYMPGSERKQAEHLNSAGENYVCGAEAAQLNRDINLAAKYYIQALLAFEQADNPARSELIETTLKVLDQLESHYRSQAVVNTDMLIKVWYNSGLICLEAARSSKDKSVHYFQRAWEYYGNKIVRAIIDKSLPSFPELSFARERINILEDEYEKLQIVAPGIISNLKDLSSLLQTAVDRQHN